jgi:hypothetical protein
MGGLYVVASHNFTLYVVTLTGQSNENVLTITPTYNNGVNGWFNIITSNVTIANLLVIHTYNYSLWDAPVINSAPLFRVSGVSYVKLNSIIFTTSLPSDVISNPILVGVGVGSVISIENSSFMNINLDRVPLFYDNQANIFNIVNSTFGCVLAFMYVYNFLFKRNYNNELFVWCYLFYQHGDLRMLGQVGI